jgi:hypothetical protein
LTIPPQCNLGLPAAGRGRFPAQENKADGRKTKEKAEGNQSRSGRKAKSGGRNPKRCFKDISMAYGQNPSAVSPRRPTTRQTLPRGRRLLAGAGNLKDPTMQAQ